MNDKNKNIPAEPFIPFGRYLLADRRDRLITYRELELYNWIRFHANMFGIANISTGQLLDDLRHFKSVDYINKTLRSLREKGYISYEDRKGVRSSFGVRFDYWLGEGGSIWILDKDGHYVLRGERLPSSSSTVDVAPMLGSHSPMSDDKEPIENSTQNDSTTKSVVRGDKNDKEIEKEKETHSASTPLKREKMLTYSFVPKGDAEKRCKEIAIEVGDEYINFILSVLNNKNGGIKVIEEAFLRFQDVIRIAEEKGDVEPIDNPPAFFNTCIQDVIYDNQDRIKNPHLYE